MNRTTEPLPPDTAQSDDLIAKEEYISAEFAALERERLWPRVWQLACREEEIPKVGDYVTYDVNDESIIVIRTAAETISAYHNVCQHRGNRLTQGCGHTIRLFCRFHGWSWKLDGSIANVVDRHDWNGTLTDEDLALPRVQVGTWGGFVFINMDENAEPLIDFLSPIPEVFANYPFQRMRYRWYKSTGLECNWKTALEAFDEAYHVQTTHNQLLPMHEDQSVAKAEGKHGMFMMTPGKISFGARSARLSPQDVDYRRNVHEFIQMNERDLAAMVTERTVRVSERLLSELPENAPLADVLMKLGEISHEAAKVDGIELPALTSDEIARAGNDWHVFPNMVFLPAPDGMLAYRARPDRRDPERCIFDVYSLALYPEGLEPPLDRLHFENWQDHDSWGLILEQDFANMAQVQRGMRSRSFKAARTNPVQERVISNFHRVVREYISED